MRFYFIALVVTLLPRTITAQQFTTSRIFAHNDYAGSNPFHRAYGLQVGYIEVDVFLVRNALMVAHEASEIQPDRTLEDLYLRPLSKHVEENSGFAFKDRERHLTLMIDLKTAGVPTLNAIVRCLKNYPELLSCPTLQIMISGNVPDPQLWEDFPLFIYFDGRPGIEYTKEQLKRVSMISTNFRNHIRWNGEGRLPDDARATMSQLMATAHSQGKKFRFWATPDCENAWAELMSADVDVIVTDKVPALAEFLKAG